MSALRPHVRSGLSRKPHSAGGDCFPSSSHRARRQDRTPHVLFHRDPATANLVFSALHYYGRACKCRERIDRREPGPPKRGYQGRIVRRASTLVSFSGSHPLARSPSRFPPGAKPCYHRFQGDRHAASTRPESTSHPRARRLALRHRNARLPPPPRRYVRRGASPKRSPTSTTRSSSPTSTPSSPTTSRIARL